MTAFSGLLGASPLASGLDQNQLSYPALRGVKPFDASKAKTPFLASQMEQINRAMPQNLFAPPNVTQTTRSQTQAPRIAGLGQTYDQNQAQAKQSLADWTKEYIGTKQGAKSNLTQENQAIGSYYGSGPGSVQGELARMAQRSNAAANLAAQRALAQAQRRNDVFRMNRGNSSYADSRYADDASRIAVDLANQRAQQERDDFLYRQQGQMNLLGRRNSLMDDYLRRDLVPLETNQRLLGNNAALLGSIGGLENQNSVFDATRPEDAIQRRLGLLGSLSSFQDSGMFGSEPQGALPPAPTQTLPPAPVTPPMTPEQKYQALYDAGNSGIVGGSNIVGYDGLPRNFVQGAAPFQPPPIGTTSGPEDPTRSAFYAADVALGREGKSPSFVGGVRRIQTASEYQALPSGTMFVDPQGNRRVKP